MQATSQFEDTKIFGPANSFVFTIEEGGFMGASPPIGEWHMHCHVLGHMMMGMMGSLLVVNGGEIFFALPVGVPCDMPKMGGGGNGGAKTHQIIIRDATVNGFDPKVIDINVGDTVTWMNNHNQPHTATQTSGPGPNFDTGTIDATKTSAPVTFNTAGTINYKCNFHPTKMTGTIRVN